MEQSQLFMVSRTLGTRQRCTFLMGCWWYVCGTVRVGWGGVGWGANNVQVYFYTHVMLRYCTFLLHLNTHVMLRSARSLALAHIGHATLLHVSLALAHTRRATLLTSTHTSCYATARFSCTSTLASCYATARFSCTCTHTSCYVCGNTYASSSTDITIKTRNPSCSGWKTSFAYFCSSGPGMMIHTKHCKYQVKCSILIDLSRVLRRRVTFLFIGKSS